MTPMRRMTHAADDARGRRHLVFVCLVFHPDSSATSMLFTDLLRRLAGPDLRITVLCGFPSKDGFQGRALPRREWLDSVDIIRCGWRLEGKRTLWSRTLAYTAFLAHAGVWLLLRGRDATVVGGTDPPFTAVALWLYSLLGRFRYEEMLLDAYPEGLVALGILRTNAVVTRCWRAANRRAYHRAGAITVIGRDMLELMGREYGVDSAKLRYVPHWGTVEVDMCTDLNRRPLLPDLGLGGKFVVQYSGNMGLWHDLETVVRTASRLRDEPQIHFLFIGKGRRRAGAERLAQDLGLSNITWLEFLPREQLGDSLLSCDAAVVSLRAGLEGIAVPSKLYGILACGRPVIASVPRTSEIALTVEENQCGVVVPPGSIDALANAILALAGNRAETHMMGRRARKAYDAHYTLEQAVRTFRLVWAPPESSEGR